MATSSYPEGSVLNLLKTADWVIELRPNWVEYGTTIAKDRSNEGLVRLDAVFLLETPTCAHDSFEERHTTASLRLLSFLVKRVSVHSVEPQTQDFDCSADWDAGAFIIDLRLRLRKKK